VVHFLGMDDPRPEAENGAAEPRQTPDQTRTARVRCSAIVPHGFSEPTELRDAMRRRGVVFTCYWSVYDALLAMLREEPGSSQALVFVESGALPDDQAARLARAASRHMERVSLWSYDRGRDGEAARLRPYAPAKREVVMRSWTPPTASAPRLRLAGFHDEPEQPGYGSRDEGGGAGVDGEERPFPSPPEGETPESDHPSELLTSEEIAMLLDDSKGGSDREENKA